MPRGTFGPISHRVRRPRGVFVGVAGGTWIWDLVFVGGRWIDEREGVRADFDVGNGGLDLGHVARDALAAGRARLVMRMFLEGGSARSIERHRAVAIEAKFVGRLAKLRVIFRAVRVVASETGDFVAVHH